MLSVVRVSLLAMQPSFHPSLGYVLIVTSSDRSVCEVSNGWKVGESLARGLSHIPTDFPGQGNRANTEQ